MRGMSRGLLVLLGDTFLMWCGFFLLVPLFSVHFVDDLGWSAATVGFVLAVRQILQQGLGPLSGMLSDRFGIKPLICAGLLGRAIGFALTANADSVLHLTVAAAIAAIGGGLFEAPKAAAVAEFAGDEDRSRFYAMVNTVGAIGMAIGMQVGVILLHVSFSAASWVATSCFVIAFLITLVWLPSPRSQSVRPIGASGLVEAFRDRIFRNYTLILTGFWFVWVQFTISVPLRATDIAGKDILRWVFLINTGMTIVFGYAAVRIAARFMQPWLVLVSGVTISALGYFFLGLGDTEATLLISVVVIAFGSLVAYPTQQAVAADLANPAAIGSYLGMNALALAIGGGLGNILGGYLYDLGQIHSMPALPWIIFALIGLATAAGLALTLGNARNPTFARLEPQHTNPS
jgi:DHA1 family multidrug resistance protein-like MFS transporter